VAVSGMKKLSVVTPREDADGLLYALQRLRCVELQTENAPPPPENDSGQLTAAIAQAGEAIDFLSGYRVKTRGLFASPIERDWDQHWPEGEALAAQAIQLSQRMTQIRTELTALQTEREGLLPWKAYTRDLPESRTKYTRTVCGLLTAGTAVAALEEELAAYACTMEEIPQAIPETEETVWVRGVPVKATVKQKISHCAIAVTAWQEDWTAVSEVLNRYGFVITPCRAASAEGGAAGRLHTIAGREAALTEEQDSLRKEAETLAENQPMLEEYHDKLTTIAARREAADKLAYTRHTAVLTGWVPVKMEEKVTALLEERGDAYQFTEPEPEDDVPVLLENNAMAAQFEPVVALYSMPAYGSFDPTFIMSFFYIPIFGLMFADVGYGILLTLACLLAVRFMQPTGSLRKFLNMFAMCGVAMVVMGALFGGYFGDLPQAIAQNFGGRTEEMDLSLWFNPLNDPMLFLVVSIAVGAIHLFTGLAVQFYVLWRKGDKTAAVCDAGSWMLIFLGAGIAFLWLYPGLAVVGVGVLMLICTQGRHEKNPIMKIVKGVGSLYGIVNYVSDLLSYSRILSLGLASAVIASVFNIIGTMAGPTVIGVLMLLIVGTIGHAMNLAVNLLGAFVHTSRLQYIEFFGKFYEDGGSPFTPLTPHTKYIRLK